MTSATDLEKRALPWIVLGAFLITLSGLYLADPDEPASRRRRADTTSEASVVLVVPAR